MAIKYNLTKEIMNQLAYKVNGNNKPLNEKPNRTMQSRVKKNVYKRHGMSENQPTNEYSDNNNRNHILAVFTGTDVGVEDAIRELNEGKKYGVTYDIAVSESAEEILEIDFLKEHLRPERTFTERDKLNTDEVLEGVSGIIVPMTTQNTVAKLSLGIQDTFISFALWQSLWHGKPVLIDFKNVIKYKGNYSKQPMLQTIIEDYIAKLSNMGVKKVERKSYISELLKALDIKEKTHKSIQNNTNDSHQKNNSNIQKVVITERDLKQMGNQGGDIIVPRGSIITSLAYDTAKKLGINIIKK